MSSASCASSDSTMNVCNTWQTRRRHPRSWAPGDRRLASKVQHSVSVLYQGHQGALQAVMGLFLDAKRCQRSCAVCLMMHASAKAGLNASFWHLVTQSYHSAALAPNRAARTCRTRSFATATNSCSVEAWQSDRRYTAALLRSDPQKGRELRTLSLLPEPMRPGSHRPDPTKKFQPDLH
jgi:hypothetical protein